VLGMMVGKHIHMACTSENNSSNFTEHEVINSFTQPDASRSGMQLREDHLVLGMMVGKHIFIWLILLGIIQVTSQNMEL
jgi:hypothetical protein